MSFAKILDQTRIRQNHNGFGFIPHRFLRDGFLSSLDRSETTLYLFYVLAANRHGVSFYSDRRICDLLGFSDKQLRLTRDGLIDKDLICYEEPVCQILELPHQPVSHSDSVPCNSSFSELRQRIGRVP